MTGFWWNIYFRYTEVSLSSLKHDRRVKGAIEGGPYRVMCSASSTLCQTGVQPVVSSTNMSFINIGVQTKWGLHGVFLSEGETLTSTIGLNRVDSIKCTVSYFGRCKSPSNSKTTSTTRDRQITPVWIRSSPIQLFRFPAGRDTQNVNQRLSTLNMTGAWSAVHLGRGNVWGVNRRNCHEGSTTSVGC